MVANPDVLDRSSVYWAHRYVFNVAKIKYSYAMKEVIRQRDALESAGAKMIRELDEKAAANSLDTADMNKAVSRLADLVLKQWWDLPDYIVAKYADGYINDGDSPGYPDWWLKAVGYENGPPPPPPEASYTTASSAEQCVRACPSGEEFVGCTKRCLAAAAIVV